MAIPDWQTDFIEVGERAYAYVQAGGGFCVSNAGMLLTEDGPIAIDALFTPAMTEAFQDAALGTAGGGARLLINTHHHIDHTLGNTLFDAPILAQSSARAAMERAGLPKERLLQVAPSFEHDLASVERIRLPSITFDDKLTIHDRTREIFLTHVGRAHTVGDILIHIPDNKLLYAGDIAFFYVTPLAADGNISNWIGVLDTIAGMDVEIIVPGHGPVGSKRDLAEQREYFVLIRDEARAAYDRRLDAADAARAIYPKLGRFAEWGEAERLFPNVMRLYSEFDGRPDDPLDAARVFAGMLEFKREIEGTSQA